MSLSSEIEAVLKDVAEIKSEARDAKKDQYVVSGIEAQTQVVELGVAYWIALQPFIMEKRLISSQDDNIAIRMACQIPSKLPNSYQSQRLLQLAERAASEGWRYGNG
ncbi:MAG: hypothetical protein KGZ53_01810 [Peptococcaceae bacterium]|nr:hypothetical protein [Peptococcaceae bacterium]